MRRLILIILFFLFLPSTSHAEKPRLHLYNWWSYLDTKTIQEFEEKYNAKIILETYQTNEEMIEKMISGGDSVYDVVFPTDRFINSLKKLGLISKIDKKKIKNLKYIRKDLPNRIYDPNSEYAIPYQWGSLAIVYNKNKVKITDNSWDVLFNLNKTLKGKIAIISNLREAIAAALLKNHDDINTCDLKKLATARDSLHKIKPYMGYVVSDIVPYLVKEQVWLALSWQGEALFAKKHNPNIQFIIPNQEPIIFTDVMVIPKNAPNKELAHKFINFVISEKINARISNFSAYNSPNINSVKYIKDATQKKLHTLIDKSSKTMTIKTVEKCRGEYNKIWRDFTSTLL